MATRKCAYPVEFVEDLFGENDTLARVLRDVTGVESPRMLIVADMNVVQRTAGLGSKIGAYVTARNIRLAGKPVVLPGGEKIKADGLQSVTAAVSAIRDVGLGRNDVVVAIGGGTVLDVAGFATVLTAARPKLVRVPTTPAAMTDAAFADSATVDWMSGKDALRVVCEPAAVLIDTGFAATVLDGVWRGGVGEAVRLAAGGDAAFFKKLVKLAPDYRNREMAALQEIVRGAVAVRQKKGPCAIGSWEAARLESMSAFKLPHGYAVSIGVCVEAAYAEKKGVLKPADREAVCGILTACGALDGLAHSRHMLNQAENVLRGLDDWALAAETVGVETFGPLGKTHRDGEPDRQTYAQVMRELAAIAKDA